MSFLHSDLFPSLISRPHFYCTSSFPISSGHRFGTKLGHVRIMWGKSGTLKKSQLSQTCSFPRKSITILAKSDTLPARDHLSQWHGTKTLIKSAKLIINKNEILQHLCRQRCRIWARVVSDWLQMRQIRDFFRSNFSTFSLGETKSSDQANNTQWFVIANN